MGCELRASSCLQGENSVNIANSLAGFNLQMFNCGNFGCLLH